MKLTKAEHERWRRENPWSHAVPLLREPMNVHPDVLERLRRLLMCGHPGVRGVNYTEFLSRALDDAEAALAAEEPA